MTILMSKGNAFSLQKMADTAGIMQICLLQRLLAPRLRDFSTVPKTIHPQMYAHTTSLPPEINKLLPMSKAEQEAQLSDNSQEHQFHIPTAVLSAPSGVLIQVEAAAAFRRESAVCS